MNTKGTHINFHKKRRAAEAASIAVLTLCSIACVCAPKQIVAQQAKPRPAINSMYTGTFDPVQESLWQIRGRSWMIAGIQRSFGLNELDEPWILAGVKRSKYSLALGSTTTGWDKMRQWVTAGSVGFSTDRSTVAIGAELLMLRLQQPYKNDYGVTFRADLRTTIADNVEASMSGVNMLGSSWYVGGDPFERKLILRLSSMVLPEILVGGALGVSDQFPTDYQTNALWRANDVLEFSLLAGSTPSRIEMGIRIDNTRWTAGSGFGKITNSSIGWRKNYWLGRISP